MYMGKCLNMWEWLKYVGNCFDMWEKFSEKALVCPKRLMYVGNDFDMW